jgi:Na+-translocating ferredoxin:NAD+ oxidoreductase subunit G
VHEITKMLIVLTAISVVSGSSLSFLEHVTRDPINYQKLKFVKGPAVLAVLEGCENDPVKDYRKEVLFQKNGDVETRKSVFPAIKNGKLFALAFEIKGKGYHGPIDIMIGIDVTTGKLTGMRIMTHSETPGLGARAVEPEFYDQFSGIGIEEAALSDKGGAIDSISGATLTSTGVSEAVKKGMELFEHSKETILKEIKSE